MDVTDQQLKDFRSEAGSHGDKLGFDVCCLALGGDEWARGEVAGWIQDARDMDDGDDY